MSYPQDWDTATGEQEKKPALVVAPIHGVIPYDGDRNPLTRSNTASRVSMQIATPATAGVPKLYHFDGEREMAVGLKAILSPALYGLEVQLPPIMYKGADGELHPHSFDIRITFHDRFRRAVFVRNGTSLAKRKTKYEIEAIFAATPDNFADDKIVVNGDDYNRVYRDNLRRAWDVQNDPNDEADIHVEERARNTSYWLIRELVANCDLLPGDAMQSVIRLIGRGVLQANWHAVICEYSRVWLTN